MYNDLIHRRAFYKSLDSIKWYYVFNWYMDSNGCLKTYSYDHNQESFLRLLEKKELRALGISL